MKGPLYLVCLFAAAVIATDTITRVPTSEPQIGVPPLPPNRNGCWGRFSKWCSHFVREEHHYLTSPAAATASTSTSLPDTAPPENSFPFSALPDELFAIFAQQKGLELDDIKNLRSAFKEARNQLPVNPASEDETFEAAADARLLRSPKPKGDKEELLKVLREHPYLARPQAHARVSYGEVVAAEFRELLHAIRTEEVDTIQKRFYSETLPKAMLRKEPIFREIFNTAIMWNRLDVVKLLVKHDSFVYLLFRSKEYKKSHATRVDPMYSEKLLANNFAGLELVRLLASDNLPKEVDHIRLFPDVEESRNL